eukprot:CAMPEP_0115164004 /NCGR_PEP_ID=MMETSP0227-20121206/72805_1 /TAXON_ID=89957 /ORGANISM="Polarella glacialis, Strain CCMP 1383" /LENGTH=71 /DNA_ID=CAMNT_0002576335 /DNA_START=1205 /DNA_END=1417 /DNA_ORIENTATION=+
MVCRAESKGVYGTERTCSPDGRGLAELPATAIAGVGDLPALAMAGNAVQAKVDMVPAKAQTQIVPLRAFRP